MHLQLIQSISLAGDLNTPNDDRAGMALRHAWIIDGATDLGPPGLVGPQGGAAWLASQAQTAFTASGACSMEALLRGVVEHVRAAWQRDRTREPKERWELPTASALAVLLTEARLEIGWLGDCVALLWQEGEVTRLGSTRGSRTAEVTQAEMLAHHGLGSVKRSAPILESLRAARGRLGRGVLGVDSRHAVPETDRVICGPADELLLMSDGYATLMDDYGAFDEVGLFAAVRSRGLAELGSELRVIEQDDAACHRYPRFKTSDDATAIWLRVGE